jgi:DNA polymerase III alpha subunit (gram-positive type)
MKNKIMLDLETMGNDSKSAIIAIGAVAFNNNEVVDKFYTQINLASSMQNGGFIDGSTVMWWLKQSNEARSAFADNDNAPHLQSALLEFGNWYNKVNGGEVWGNGAMFDNSILSSAYKNCGFEQPWKFWDDMCYRTVKNMNKHIKLNRVGTYHNAVDDAESQALHLIEILKSK